jgi:hypothetical protein
MTALLTNEFLKLSWSARGLSLLRRKDDLVLFRHAEVRINDYSGRYLDLFQGQQLEILPDAAENKVRFISRGNWIDIELKCRLVDSELHCQATLTNPQAKDCLLGDICLLHLQADLDSESHLLTNEIDVFSLGALSGETMEAWSKDVGNKKAFAMRLNAAEPYYKSDNIISVRPLEASTLSREITMGFDRIGEAACGFTIDLKARVASARVALRGAALPAGQTRVLPTLIVDGVRAADKALDAMVDRVAAIYQPPVPERVATGWCSWYYYYAHIREEDILENLRFLASHREKFPYEYVQIDDGYQLHWGDWLLPGNKFPHDMAWLAGEIKKLGFKPGIWVAPLIMTVQSNLFQEHPEWALRRHDTGEIYTMEGWSGPNENPWVVIDGTHPGYLAHLGKMFSTLAHDWGYDYFKLDAAAFAAHDGLRHDPTKTGVEAVRLALQAIRQAIGPDKYILACGVPFGAAVGIANGQRVSDDVSTAFKTEQFGCSMENALPQSIHRSLIQGKWGHNDPDCVLVRAQGTPHESKIAEKGLSLEEARFFITVIGLTQGIQMVGENMLALDEERLGLLETIIPVMPSPARPLNLFSARPQRLLTRTPYGLLVAFLNWSEKERVETLTWPELELPLTETREIFEFWTQSYLGASSGSLEITNPAQGCRLLFLTAQKNHPAFLAFDGHISCGAALLKDERWNAESGKLTLEFTPNRIGKLFLISPKNWLPVNNGAQRISDSIWILPVSPGNQRLEIKFEEQVPS